MKAAHLDVIDSWTRTKVDKALSERLVSEKKKAHTAVSCLLLGGGGGGIDVSM